MRSGEERAVALRQWAAALLMLALVVAGCSEGGGETAAQAPVPEGAGELAAAGQELYHHPDQAFIAAARLGVAPHHRDFGAMPAISGLSDADLQAIVAYVRAVQEAEGLR